LLLVGELPSLSTDGSLPKFVLLELELWLEANLSSWVKDRLQRDGNMHRAEQDLQQLQQFMADYLRKARNDYEGNPEALSLMYLNIMDLWVALDKIAGKVVPLLLQYNLGFISDFLYPLILPTKTQMARLQAIELYLSRRKRAARYGYYAPAFSDFGKRIFFAVRYFVIRRALCSPQKDLDRV
jgi:hypothetical protein